MRTKRVIRNVGIVLFVSCVAGLWVMQKKDVFKSATAYQEKAKLKLKDSDEKKELFVRVWKVKQVDFKDSLDGLIGTVKGSSFELRSSQEERLVCYHHKTGDRVRKGTLIAELDHTRVKAKLRQAEFAYNRVDNLFKAGGATAMQLDEAHETVALARKDFDDTFIVAPKDGTIGETVVQEGELVTRQNPILNFVSNEKQLYVETNVIEKNVQFVKPGCIALMHTESIPDKEIVSTVTSVSPEATTASRMVPVTISIPSEYIPLLKPGLSAQVSIRIYEHTGLVVPKSAVVFDSSSVYVVEGNKATQRAVRYGYQTRDYVEILDGLTEGELVLMDCSHVENVEKGTVMYAAPEEYKNN